MSNLLWVENSVCVENCFVEYFKMFISVFKLFMPADCVQTIPAHKYILATGSSVFYAMFYGGLAENKQEIKVPDVEPSAFLTLLR